MVACLDGPFSTEYGERMSGDPGRGTGEADIFADPYLDGPTAPRLGLLMLRDALPDPMTREAAEAKELTEAVVAAARETGVKVSEVTADPGHALVRLAGQIAITDFAATYLALGLGLDPAVSAHVADLRDRAWR